MIELIHQKLPQIKELCSKFNVRRLEIFGSVVTDNIAAGSDIDFLVEFKPLKEGQYADTYFGLLEAIEELLGRGVDLVMTTAVKNPYFLAVIDNQRQTLYAA